MYRAILLPIDLNEEQSWAKALPTAVASAKAFGASLRLMTVVPDFGLSIVGQYFPEGFEQKALDNAKSQLEAFAAEHVPGDLDCAVTVAHGSVYGEILHVAEHFGIDLIVMGAHRPALQDYLLGPNAARVVRHATQSVMVVRG